MGPPRWLIAWQAFASSACVATSAWVVPAPIDTSLPETVDALQLVDNGADRSGRMARASRVLYIAAISVNAAGQQLAVHR